MEVIANKDTTIASEMEVIANKDTTIPSEMEVITNKDTTIASEMEVIANKDTTIPSEMEVIANKDTTIAMDMKCEAFIEKRDLLQQQVSPNSKANGFTQRKDKSVLEDLNEVTLQAPDGGYAWVILACSFYSMFCIEGLNGSFGLLLPILMEEFKSTAAVTSMLNSTLIGIFLIISFFTSCLIERYGTRVVTFCGAWIYTLGLLLSFFAPSISFLFLTYGLLCGLGVGMVFLPSIMIVNQYFDRKRSLANGILASGAGLGLLVMSPVIEKSIDAFGWRGSLLIYACFTVQLCVCASLMRPIRKMKKRKEIKPMSTFSNTVANGTENDDTRYASLPFLNRSDNLLFGSSGTLSLPVLFGSNHSITKGSFNIGALVEVRESENGEKIQYSKTCALPAFCSSRPFIFLTIGCLLTQMGQAIPLVFIGDYGNHVGVTSADISLVLSTFGVANTIGRLFAGLIANTRCLGHLNICNIGLILSAGACFLFFLCKTVGALMGFAIAYGFFLGFFPPMQPLMIMDYLGLEQLTAGYGFVTMLKGPAAFIGSPMAGALLEMTGNYETVNGLAGILFTLAACSQMFALCWDPHSKEQESDIELEKQ
ncbi:monocarboxylate transporter 13-like [Saccostrea echinata]|uniref:monocarboxylate transporter 13-like n=1 Tax=Saccostrea echinata TaxID=191078 RepID=UPI002A80E84F|nr:monocarboxylate transporter 13-like [Saccostrea echinata]